MFGRINIFGKSVITISSIVSVPLLILSESKKNELSLYQLNSNKLYTIPSIYTYCDNNEIKKNIIKEEKKEEVIVKKEITNASNMTEEEAEVWWEEQKSKVIY
jgi:hypothetical protein